MSSADKITTSFGEILETNTPLPASRTPFLSSLGKLIVRAVKQGDAS